jgi:hypothetical protein
LTLDYLGGWHTFKPDRKALERAWRVLYNVPDSMIDLFTCSQQQWEQVVLRWVRYYPGRGEAGFRHMVAKAGQAIFDHQFD